MPRKKIAVPAFLVTAVLVTLLLMAYCLATDVFRILDKVLFPGLGDIWLAMCESFVRLNECLVSSLWLLIPGYALGAVSGIVLGVLISSNHYVQKVFQPVIFAFSPIPPSMLTPYLIALMATFYDASVAIIFLGSFWPFLGGTISGINLIDQKYHDNARVLELHGLKKLFLVTLPAAAPIIFSGAETALTFSFILLTVAEMFATDSGLGYFVQYYADFSDYARVLAGLLYTMAVFVSIMLVFVSVKRRVLFWMIAKE